ncbi:terminase small subunit [Burkholderia phage BcepNazgul]|uniref:TerS n=1 Tax=Burkholderia phage BcepNazgul TaxID=242861 RepID=Q6UYH5_9CAUD|nr:terminase small subunit [Burkholderia phage BcepNazgul]AAQ63366.1 TerS [Burkholderia phage BcepNazgul]
MAEEKSGADSASKAILFDGASISQLGQLFTMDNRTVTKRIQGLRACGKRQGHPIYKVAEAARYLVDPVGDIEAHIKKMHHRDLPPMLLKEFWSGQNARLKFEEEQGDLWRTEKVLQHYAESFKTLRTEILLMVDSVDRQAELSDKQRAIIRKMTDSLLKSLRNSLIEQFKHEPERDHEAERIESTGDSGGSGDGEDGVRGLQDRDSAGSVFEGTDDDPAAGL